MQSSAPPPAGASEGEVFFDVACRAFAAIPVAHCIDRTLAVTGLRVDFRIAAGPRQEAMNRYLSALAARPVAQGMPDNGNGLTILIWDAEQTGVDPPAPDWRATDHLARGELPRFSDGRFLFNYNIQSRVLSAIDTERRLALQCVRSFDALPQYEWGAPLRDILSWWLVAQRRPMLHSAAISAFGKGALLVGPGGSGKSTTAAQCLRHESLSFVADDYAAVALDDAIPRLHAVFGTAKLTGHALEQVPGLNSGEFATETGKFLIPLDADMIASDVPLRSILLPRVADQAESEIVPVRPGEAMLRLAPSTLFQRAGSGQREMAQMAELVRRIPSFRLKLGRSRTQLLDILTRHLLETC